MSRASCECEVVSTSIDKIRLFGPFHNRKAAEKWLKSVGYFKKPREKGEDGKPIGPEVWETLYDEEEEELGKPYEEREVMIVRLFRPRDPAAVAPA